MDSINRLNGMKTYLVGAMDRISDGGKTWRERIAPYLNQMGVKVINPCSSPIINSLENDDTRRWIDYYKETGKYDKIKKHFASIRCADLRCVDVSDFIIAHIDLSIHACGTYEEIATANRQKKPVLIWCEQGKSKAPNWLFFMLPHQHIFGDIDDLLNYLYKVNSTYEMDEFGRWVFFANEY